MDHDDGEDDAVGLGAGRPELYEFESAGELTFVEK
jgi:hypothetical protein